MYVTIISIIPNRIRENKLGSATAIRRKPINYTQSFKFLFLSFLFGSRNLFFQKLAFGINFISVNQGNDLIAILLPHAMLIPILA